jgi:hypothetical protein
LGVGYVKVKLTKEQWVFICGSLAFGILLLTALFVREHRMSEPIFTEEVNGLTIEVFDATLTEDEDTGKVIVNIPVTLTNNADHAFVFSVPHFDYNETEYVFALTSLDEGSVGGKIERGDTKSDTITVELNTRDKTEVKTVQPTFHIYDMKTEKTTEFKPNIAVQ